MNQSGMKKRSLSLGPKRDSMNDEDKEPAHWSIWGFECSRHAGACFSQVGIYISNVFKEKVFVTSNSSSPSSELDQTSVPMHLGAWRQRIMGLAQINLQIVDRKEQSACITRGYKACIIDSYSVICFTFGGSLLTVDHCQWSCKESCLDLLLHVKPCSNRVKPFVIEGLLKDSV
uniref:Metallo-hydrolase/oxidoreductase superfamily protein n=1 Tax=Tanacetum cinerariifolium TaxID=118510 RepID=A0A6L2JBK4_TANCI|nr:metallo-hydrolase/oxidoreductase superfamily protein [Tanacetum cinerariifolium]